MGKLIGEVIIILIMICAIVCQMESSQCVYGLREEEWDRLFLGVAIEETAGYLDCRPRLKISTTTAFTQLLNFCFCCSCQSSEPTLKHDNLKSIAGQNEST